MCHVVMIEGRKRMKKNIVSQVKGSGCSDVPRRDGRSGTEIQGSVSRCTSFSDVIVVVMTSSQSATDVTASSTVLRQLFSERCATTGTPLPRDKL